jgi:hypothetical protein
MMYEESVRGIIIGEMKYPYEFWTLDDPSARIHHGSLFFENDAQAIEWFKTNYPGHFAAGAEMRVFDRE